MLRKLSIWVLAILMVVQGVQGFKGMTQVYAAEGANPDSIITGVKLTILDGAGKEVTSPVIEQDSSVKIVYDWELPDGHNYGVGEGQINTFKFNLPKQFYLASSISGNLEVDAWDEDEPFGTFKVDKATHVVTMTFSGAVSKDQVAGQIGLKTTFNLEEFKDNTGAPITIPIQGKDETFNYIFKPKGDTIVKQGKPNRYNPTEIAWTIDVNKKLDSIENAVVTDKIPEGLELDKGTIAVKKIKNVKLDGTPVVEEDPIDPNEYSIENSTTTHLELSFNDLIDSAYRIEFTTKINVEAMTENNNQFENVATLSGNGDPIDAKGTANIKRGKPLEKKSGGYNPENQTIKWEMQYNYDGKPISKDDAVLNDRISPSHKLVVSDSNPEGSVEVYEIEFDDKGNEKSNQKKLVSGYTVTPLEDDNDKTKNGFDLAFDNDITSAYKIIYYTVAKKHVYEPETIENKVTSGTITKSDSVGIDHYAITKKLVKKDYDKKTLDWEIKINRNEIEMTNVKLIDTFNYHGLKLVDKSFTIKNSSNQPVNENDYTFKYDEDSHSGLTIEFHTDVKDVYTIKYQTVFDIEKLDSEAPYFENTGALTWTDLTGTYTKKAWDSFNPNSETKKHGYKSGSYDATSKEITWEIGVNYNKKTVSGAKLADKLLSNQKLVDKSLHVYKMNIDGSSGKVSKGDEYGEYTSTVKNGVLEVVFENEISEPYIIEFKTSLQDQFIDSIVSNTAYLNNSEGKKVTEDLTGFVTVNQGGEYVYKEQGAQDDDMIKWRIHINRSQSTVSNAKLTDKPTPNQHLVESSFKLFTTQVDKNGNLTQTSDEVPSKDYAITIKKDVSTGDPFFELIFKNDLKVITSAYVLEYSTLIDAEPNDEVGNTVSFSGSGIKDDQESTPRKTVVVKTEGWGTGSGILGKLTVNKFDEKNNSIKLKGAEFKLYRKSASAVALVDILTTGKDGVAIIENLRGGKYILEETKAPNGYKLDGTLIDVTIDNTTKEDPEDPSKIAVIVNVPNEKSPTKPGTGTGNPSTPTPTETPTPSVSPSPTPSVSPSPSASPSPSPSVTPSTTPGSGDSDNPDGTDASLGGSGDSNNGSVKGDGDQKGDKGGKELPKTGENGWWPYQLAGAAVLLFGIILLARKKRYPNQSK